MIEIKTYNIIPITNGIVIIGIQHTHRIPLRYVVLYVCYTKKVKNKCTDYASRRWCIVHNVILANVQKLPKENMYFIVIARNV